MDIATSVSLAPDEETQLAALFDITAAELPAKLGAFGKAALREYVDMLLGQSTVRSPEMREQRLLMMILHTFDGDVPSEAEIAQTFNLTGSSARSLGRSVLSRYRLRLAGAKAAAGVKVLASCGEENEGFRRVMVENAIIVEYLNDLLVEINGALKRITRESKTGTTYLVAEDSYVALYGKLNP